jgi:ubiquinone/menaquinone biosynthesis C-methylase UbiE
MIISTMTRAPYVVSAGTAIEEAFRLAEPKPGELVYDLGCGDCRVLIQAAKKYGTLGLGYDISPFCYLKSKYKIKSNHVSDLVEIRRESLHKADLSKPDIIFLYTGTEIMGMLEEPIFHKIKSTTRVVSLAFGFKNHQPLKTKAARQLGKETQIFLYKK